MQTLYETQRNAAEAAVARNLADKGLIDLCQAASPALDGGDAKKNQPTRSEFDKPQLRAAFDNALIIFGPQGSGKTKHAQALCAHYGKARVMDDLWATDEVYTGRTTADALILSHLTKSELEQAVNRRLAACPRIGIAQALKDAGIRQEVAA